MRYPVSRHLATALRCAAGLALALAATPASAAVLADTCAAKAMKPATLVEAVRAEGARFDVANLLVADRQIDAKARGVADDLARESVVHRPNPAAVKRFLRQPPDSFTLPVEVSGGRVDLELVRVDVTTADFKVVTSDSNGQAVPYEPGVHYRGKIKGDPDSHAAVSVFRDEVMGSYFTEGDGTVVIGRLLGQNPKGDHIVYPSRIIDAHHDFTCATEDDGDDDGRRGARVSAVPDGLDFLAAPGVSASALDKADKAIVKCVRVYVEAAYDIYQNKGSSSAVTNYVTGFFNQSAVLYSNESIPISLSQVYVWTSNDPYSDTGSSSTMLSGFQSYRNSFNGDVGHLVAFHGGGGIAAGFSAFCNSNIDNRQCFSGVNSSYSNVPTFSWTVQVFTHEMGHLFGSRHTHACVWNGNNTAIDGCSAPEGTCSRPGLPSGGGTIMSYCHLSGNPGINFNNGFGPQPGSTIRSRFNAASCLGTCDTGGGGGSCTTYSGTLSGTGSAAIQPNGTYYQSTTSGAHTATLSGPGSADFDLYLYKWNGSTWVIVARSEGATSTESINYSGTAGYYYWRIYSYSGSGSYSLCITKPS